MISAQGDTRVVTRENMIHNYVDVGGTVMGNATPGNCPDTGTNPPVAAPLAYMTGTSSAGTTTTDADGNFNFPGVTGPLNVTFGLVGLYNDVRNAAGAELTMTSSLSGTGNTVLMNANSEENNTAQVNIFASLNLMRDWVRAIREVAVVIIQGQ